MTSLHTALATLAVTALLAAGCAPASPPAQQPPQPAGQQGAAQPQHPELVQPMESALQALLAMNETGRNKDFVAAQQHFVQFRENWALIRRALDEADPKLAVHIEDGAVELDHEFTKPPAQIRVYELDEETVKLGRLLSDASELLGVPVRPDLVQADPTAEIPFNQEQRVAVDLVDHKIQPDVIELAQHTKVTFVVTNRGQEVHEFELGHYAVELEEIQPGETRELTLVLLDAGEFETACHIPGHYEVGMFGKLIVTPAALKSN